MRFCSNCGFDYWKAAEQRGGTASTTPAVAPAAMPGPTQAETPAEKKNTRLGCIGLAVIAVVILLIFGALSGDPEGTGTDESADPTASAPSTQEPEAGEASTEPTVPPSPEVTVPPEPAFTAFELSGTGSSVPRFEIPADNAAIAQITHTGAANFAVWTVDEAGEQTDLLVNTIGNYTGTVLFDEAGGSHSVAFDIEADGPWTIAVKPVTEAFRWDGSQPLAGSGDDVAILEPASSGLKSVTVSHQGDGNFAIWAYADFPDLMVNEIGQYSGEALLPDGTFLFEITATGPWTISPPQ
jgi:hypothetical protein